MIMLSKAAEAEMNAYFEEKEVGAIRVYLGGGGCSGPRLLLALDEATEADSTFTQGKYTFCIETGLLEKVKSATIDFTHMGFGVEPEVSLGGSGGCAGSCSGCGSN